MSDAFVRPDARKSLPELAEEWAGCTRCALGQRRVEVGGRFVFGEGRSRAIMLIAEGPGAEEEAQGRPFVGRSGEFLRAVLAHLNFHDVYMTNTVCCRSCELVLDQETGLPQMRKDRRTGISSPIFKDVPPIPPQRNACLPRLYEQIYLIDPVVIVGLGNEACETLLGRPITITRDRGEPRTIAIPGASFRPSITEGGKWRRKIKSTDADPIEQNEVRYHFIPTLHPAYVIRLLSDKDAKSPFQQFLADIKKAIATYDAYLKMAFGEAPDRSTQRTDQELQEQLQGE